MATPETLGLEPLPEGVDIKITQPPDVEWHTVDGVFIKSILLRNGGTFMRQHAHTHAHTSVVARGEVFVWKDGKLDRRYAEAGRLDLHGQPIPSLIVIEAGVWHTFQALEDNTAILCIHRLGNEILAQHGLSEDDVA